MIGLLLASIYVWAVIFAHGRGTGKTMRASERFERDFWRAGNIDKFYDENGREELPSAKVLGAGITEWSLSNAGETVARDGKHEPVAAALDAAVGGAGQALGGHMGGQGG